MIVHIIAEILTAGIFLLIALAITFGIIVAVKAIRVLLMPDLGKRHAAAKKSAGFASDQNGSVTEL